MAFSQQEVSQFYAHDEGEASYNDNGAAEGGECEQSSEVVQSKSGRKDEDKENLSSESK